MPSRKSTYVLGVESTAHTFGVSVVSSEGEILADERRTYTPPEGSGIHPRECAQHHAEHAAAVVREALVAAGLAIQQVDAVAFSAGPGLGPCLRTGATVARSLAAYYGKPLVPVHHAIGHIEIAALTTGAKDPLVLLASGGHTCITAFTEGRWRILGETQDIAVGNLLDAFGRTAGLPSPAGPHIEKHAKRGSRLIELPYTVKGNDVAFSGLLTQTVRTYESKRAELNDLCYSLQETAFAMLAEATERALAFTEKRELLLTGGVAANARLQQMLDYVAKEHGAAFHVVPKCFSGDCGAQIAWTGLLAYRCGVRVPLSRSLVKPRWRLDAVDIPWR